MVQSVKYIDPVIEIHVVIVSDKYKKVLTSFSKF